MPSLIATRAFTKAEFETVKAEIKALGIKASFRYQTQKYAFGSISITPRKQDGYLFSIEHVQALRAYLVNLGVYLSGLGNLKGSQDAYSDLAFRQGFGYIRKQG